MSPADRPDGSPVHGCAPERLPGRYALAMKKLPWSRLALTSAALAALFVGCGNVIVETEKDDPGGGAGNGGAPPRRRLNRTSCSYRSRPSWSFTTGPTAR